jgi:hypothetical protein
MQCKTCFVIVTPMDSFHKTFKGESIESFFCSMRCLHHYRTNKECMDNVSVKSLIDKFSKKTL